MLSQFALYVINLNAFIIHTSPGNFPDSRTGVRCLSMHENFSNSFGAFVPLAEEGEESCSLLGQHAASSDDLLPTFRVNLSVPFLGVKNLG